MTGALWSRMDAIERFAADVAHEIKNPLSSLRSAVETVARLDDPAQRKKLVAIIQDGVQRLDRLITDISDASRLDAELLRAKMAPVSLRGLLETLVEVYRTAREATPAGKNVTFTLSLPGLEDRAGDSSDPLMVPPGTGRPAGSGGSQSAGQCYLVQPLRGDYYPGCGAA
ncbi:MAG: two-component system OmpR family sensor histidine kinase ChvG [Rhodospirillaceae bacterium]|nr:MAG: two-component system OmpR family sensor histidine kinase ChvG [Rhodospirillaceae bacterium]